LVDAVLDVEKLCLLLSRCSYSQLECVLLLMGNSTAVAEKLAALNRFIVIGFRSEEQALECSEQFFRKLHGGSSVADATESCWQRVFLKGAEPFLKTPCLSHKSVSVNSASVMQKQSIATT